MRRRRYAIAAALLASGGAHALLLWMMGRHGAAPEAHPAAERIAVRLQAVRTAPTAPGSPAPERSPSPSPAPRSTPAPTPPRAPASIPTAPAPDPAPAGFGLAIGGGEQLAEISEVQLRYSTSLPPPVELRYAVEGTQGGAASLRWEVDGADHFRIELRGPGQVTTSTGVIGDGGINPLEASEEQGGETRRTYFDRAARQLRFSATPRSYGLVDSAQDRLSVLLQLSGVGQANPQRLKQSIVFYVGASGGAATVRFDPAGSETIDSAMGALETEHLVQVGGPGQPRLEVWLAPARHWLPVRLRSTAADGSTQTYTVTAIDTLP